MPPLTSQSALRRVQKLDFCYLCGEKFGGAAERTRDHVPPQAIFAKLDKDFPLIVSAHKSCNHAQSVTDEEIGQLVSLLHGRFPEPHRDRLAIEIQENPARAQTFGILTGVNLEPAVHRWLKAFHAALYRQPLPVSTRFATQLPFPSATLKGGKFVLDRIPDQHLRFVETLKKNRLVGNLDTIACNNEKLRYECVWAQMSDGSWGCVYGLDLYDWKNLGDIHNFPARGCAGLYRPGSARPPSGAAMATRLTFSVKNDDVLDPFAI